MNGAKSITDRFLMRYMERMVWVYVGCVLSFFAAETMAAPADGRPAPVQKSSDQDRAIEHFNMGIGHRDKAWSYEEQAEASTVEKEREQFGDKARREYEKALSEQLQAITLDPAMFEAYSSCGYAQRKLGHFAEALKSYDRALELNADYMEAVEYRAEAYLELNRIGGAQDAYALLFRRDPERAELLLLAFDIWLARPPTGIKAIEIEQVRSWIVAKEETAREMGGTTGEGQKEW
jgi:tetratricopeptide (TPR) repeat protein